MGDVGVELTTGAGAWAQVAVAIDAGAANAAGAPKDENQIVHGGELGLGRSLAFEVAQEDNADIPLVVAEDMGAFVGKRARFPDASDIIDCQMIGNIAVAAGPVGAEDGVKLAGNIGVGGGKKWISAFVMDGDAGITASEV